MSESSDSLHVFYRYTVPGVAITTWIFFTLPSAFVLRISESSGGAALFVSFLLGSSLVIGWLSYYSLYPLWRGIISSRPLKALNLYPKSTMIAELSDLIEKGKLKLNSQYVWSYFLWNHCSDSIRDRIKGLADFAHSLYLVSLAFVAMPLILVLTTVAWGQYSMFAWTVSALVSGTSTPTLETALLLLSIGLGIYLLYKGKERLSYSQNLELLLFRELRQSVEETLPKLSQQPK